jgi:hypothetical protein
MKDKRFRRISRPTTGNPTSAPRRGAFNNVRRYIIQDTPNILCTPKHPIIVVERYCRARHPNDFPAAHLFNAIRGPRRHDDQLVAVSRCGIQFFVHVCPNTATGLGVELRNINDLHLIMA